MKPVSWLSAWFARGGLPALMVWFGALVLWMGLSLHRVDLNVVFCLLCLVMGTFVLGDTLACILFRSGGPFDSVPFRILSGFLVGLVLLYVLAITTPWGLPKSGAVLCGGSLVVWLWVRRCNIRYTVAVGGRSEVFFIVVALMASSFWCQDLLRPIDSSQDVTVIRVWGDVYYHLSQIGVLAKSMGGHTISDVQMAGAPAHPYHFASYLFPALLVRETGISAWTAYAAFLVPVAIFMTGLAAYVLVAPVFGGTPAVCAGLGLLLLPDAFQQGFRNPFMAYHWLQQVAPAGGFGVASAALAFAFMMEACRKRRPSLIGASYALVLATLMLKAQIFVALAYIVLIFPALFYGGAWPRWLRGVVWIVLTAIYLALSRASQTLPGVPVLRLDGSSLTTFANSVLGMQLAGPLKEIFKVMFELAGGSHTALTIAFAVMLLFITFGVFPILYGIQWSRLKSRLSKMDLLFPVLIVGNFLLMATGLALDDRHIGMPEELLHRPFVWAYFVLVTWTMGGVFYLCFGEKDLAYAGVRVLPVAMVVALLVAVPGYFGRKIQTMQSWGLGYQELPSCLVRSAAYLRSHSDYMDVVQVANNDPKYVFSALSERQAYAVDSGGYRTPNGLEDRLREMDTVRSLHTFEDVLKTLQGKGIAWYVIGPNSGVVWEPQVASSQWAFICGDYRVIRVQPVP